MKKALQWLDENLEEVLLVIALAAMAVIMGIQVIATLIILFSIFKLNILPTTYAVMVGMILVLFLVHYFLCEQ